MRLVEAKEGRRGWRGGRGGRGREGEREMVEWSKERVFVPVSGRRNRRFPPLTAGAPRPPVTPPLAPSCGVGGGTGSYWSQRAWNVSPYGRPPASSRRGKSAPWTLRRRSAQGSAEESAQFGRTPVGYQTSSNTSTTHLNCVKKLAVPTMYSERTQPSQFHRAETLLGR